MVATASTVKKTSVRSLNGMASVSLSSDNGANFLVPAQDVFFTKVKVVTKNVLLSAKAF